MEEKELLDKARQGNKHCLNLLLQNNYQMLYGFLIKLTGDKDLDAKFVAEAKAAGLENLKGHRTVGGMRASIYNAMPTEGVKALVEFMKKFEEENA